MRTTWSRRGWLVGSLLALLVVVRAVAAFAQTDAVSPVGTAYAFEAVTVSTTSVGFTATTISSTTGPGAKSAHCSVETQPIRFKLFGVPTSVSGHPKAAGTELVIVGLNNMLTFRAIRSGAADATLSCTYFR